MQWSATSALLYCHWASCTSRLLSSFINSIEFADYIMLGCKTSLTRFSLSKASLLQEEGIKCLLLYSLVFIENLHHIDVMKSHASNQSALHLSTGEENGDASALATAAEALMNLHPWEYYLPNGTMKGSAVLAESLANAALVLDADNPLANHLIIHLSEASSSDK